MPFPVAEPLRVDGPLATLSEHMIEIAPASVSSGATYNAFDARTVRIFGSREKFAAPWFDQSVSQFRSIMDLAPGWDTYHGQRTAFTAVQKAVQFLGAHLADRSLPPTVVPLSDGGVEMVWHQNGVDLEVTVAADGETEVYVRDLASGDEFAGDVGDQNGAALLAEAFQRLSV